MTWVSDTLESLAHQWSDEFKTYVIATVLDAGGSTPRLAGARLISNGDTFGGTIGGGAIEKLVLERANELLGALEQTAMVDVHLVRDLGMCCGGKMTVFLNKVQADDQMLIFGAGHIGRALAQLAVQLSFRVSLIDSRDNWTDPKELNEKINVINEEPEWYIKTSQHLAQSYVLIATHSHALDQDLVEALLTQEQPLNYLGLIGSRAKWKRFYQRLENKGISIQDLDRVFCPSGLDINAQTPPEIAISVLAQMVQMQRSRS